ncbi:dihydrodiol dehydrogenase [Rhodococcus fascians]|nr:dihydrodiol dehydrogenase [Rhodococcus fascians]MBY3826512.1 dihydrodiol dehydrogenase [Rhodococcus fascians]MBY3836973.1 dihydrodiol dehydrogenase [Rhodococcus fascians]MBY3865560.1 dihydrodiol dehydrogenase [Rhodococcus fascians]MBY3885655.1 dihydrodiol dehydrogenase [Rhodococcus fascians]
MTTSAESTERLRLANEFADVYVERKVHGNGQRLEIVSPRTGQSILLDPVILEALTALDLAALTAILVAGVPGNDLPD